MNDVETCGACGASSDQADYWNWHDSENCWAGYRKEEESQT